MYNYNYPPLAARIERERSLSPHVLTVQTHTSLPFGQQSSKGLSRTRRHSSEAMGDRRRELMRFDEKGLVTIFVKWRGSSPQKNLNVLVSLIFLR